MRTSTVALVAAASLMTVAVATGASAAGPSDPTIVQLAQAATPQQAQYYPGYRHHYRDWDYYRPYHHHWHGYGWRYSEAEELNRQELQRLGVAP